ncbi:sulfite exporter TauE/SafE family protein [Siminovitchia sediminis]|uniref:Probable membrane transporter protein n=1 Tax=Siminovitchia sediminis TaxID=1274353 RepID=A0ABW4KHT3_9BACI
MLIIIGSLMILVASFIQGVTGFGFAVVAVPLLSLLFPLQVIVPMLVLLGIFVNFYIFYPLRRYVEFKKIRGLVFFSIIATPVGAYLLVWMNQFYLQIVAGMIILVFGAFLWTGRSFHIKNEKSALGIVGMLSGLLNGSLGLFGLPIALFMANQKTEKNIFRANIALLGLIVCALTFLNYMYMGLINREVLEYSMWLFLALLIGLLAGVKVDKFINQTLFMKISLLVIMVSGLFTIIFAV